jgi:hypothetical protein
MSDKDILAAPPEQHLHDLRAVYDMGNLHLDPTATAGNQSWSVVRLNPDPYSGSETLVGAALDAKTGQLINAATGKPAADSSFSSGMIEEGSWVPVTRIGVPRGKQRGRYKWTKPLEYEKRRLDPEDIYRPFVKGGTVLCKHNPEVEGATQFDAVSLLPTGWEAHVSPAFDALKKNKVLSRQPASAVDKMSLKALMANANAITSTIAFRSLSESGNLDSKTVQQTLSKATGYHRAVLMYIALVHAPAAGPSTIEPALTQAVQGTSGPADNRSAALAFTAVALFHPNLPQSRTLSVNLLNAMRSGSAPSVAGQKTASVARQKADPYLEELLKTAQIL